MIVIAVVALIAEWLLTMVEDRLLTWQPETSVSSDQFCNLTPSITTVDAELDPGEVRSASPAAACHARARDSASSCR